MDSSFFTKHASSFSIWEHHLRQAIVFHTVVSLVQRLSPRCSTHTFLHPLYKRDSGFLSGISVAGCRQVRFHLVLVLYYSMSLPHHSI
jgi:hypothetical protein